MLGLYESLLKKTEGADKLEYLLPYSYFLERIGQSTQMLKTLPEIIALDP